MLSRREEFTVFRIYVENVEFQESIDLVAEIFPGFSLYTGFGYWQGKSESTVTFEIVTDESARKDVEILSHKLRKLNRQDVVFITEHSAKGVFVS